MLANPNAFILFVLILFSFKALIKAFQLGGAYPILNSFIIENGIFLFFR